MQQIEIMNKYGLHIRVAKEIVELASGYSSDIYIARENDVENKVSARSMLGLMSIGAVNGDIIIIEADGDDAEDAIKEITNMLNTIDFN